MKDIKSYVIGFLSCACLFLIMGQNKKPEVIKFDGIIVDHLNVNGSIKVKDDNGNYIYIQPKGLTIVSEENYQTLMDPTTLAQGKIINDQFNVRASMIVEDGADAGLIKLYNTYGNLTSGYGSNGYNNGLINVYDKDGNRKWQAKGD